MNPNTQEAESRCFDRQILERAMMSEADAVAFRAEARHRVFHDPGTNTMMLYFIHPDGRILFDSIMPVISTDFDPRIDGPPPSPRPAAE